MFSLITHLEEYLSKYDMFSSDISVGLSGGADSMALCFALSECFSNKAPDITVHALSIDHGLRSTAAAEAIHVSEQLKSLSNVKHYILKWEHDKKPDARVQELARLARYNLMQEYMQGQGIKHLFLGHHMDDQAETFLFRLAKGSGVDGLACMAEMKIMSNDFILCRPMLGVSKTELVDFCVGENIEFINDPSNNSDNYARVRIRKSMEVLAKEGLTPKRLAVCAYRHARARDALDNIASKEFDNDVIELNKRRIVFNLSGIISNPDEIILRVILLAMDHLSISEGYGARMSRVENLCSDLTTPKNFRKRTLGGIIFECDTKNNLLTLCIE